jgi:hypothetical protein
MYHDIRRRVRQYELGGRDGTAPRTGPEPAAWVVERYGVSRARAEELITAALAVTPEGGHRG